MWCNQCEMLSINGKACHETGCPNAGKTWDANAETWVRMLECRNCGFDVEEGEICDCQLWEDEEEPKEEEDSKEL